MSRTINKQRAVYLYQQVVDLIKDMQQHGTLNAGEKLPSLRAMAQHSDAVGGSLMGGGLTHSRVRSNGSVRLGAVRRDGWNCCRGHG